jgi:hypothetical protein
MNPKPPEPQLTTTYITRSLTYRSETVFLVKHPIGACLESLIEQVEAAHHNSDMNHVGLTGEGGLPVFGPGVVQLHERLVQTDNGQAQADYDLSSQEEIASFSKNSEDTQAKAYPVVYENMRATIEAAYGKQAIARLRHISLDGRLKAGTYDAPSAGEFISYLDAVIDKAYQLAWQNIDLPYTSTQETETQVLAAIEPGNKLDTEICFILGALSRDYLEHTATIADLEFDKRASSDELRSALIEQARARGFIDIYQSEFGPTRYGCGHQIEQARGEAPCH